MKKEVPAANRPLAVVTGASNGIGFELAKQFAQHGFDLLISAGSDRLNTAQEQLAQFGTHVEKVRVDLATYEGVETLYQAILETGRPVDSIAINAGVGVGGEFAQTTELKEELNLIHLNVVSTVHLTKRIAAEMLKQGQGRILITSSVAGIMPTPFQAVYGASKAFDLMFAEAIREELAGTGVTVTALMPGATETDFFRRADLEDTEVGSEGKEESDPAEVARLGFEALMAGRDHVISASFQTKLQGLVARFLSEPTKASATRGYSEKNASRLAS